ncbi:MAG: hypothetical protein COW05_02585 [Gammaproteobacteria bacterium CG12_big_fil_rev_8_21_14_0_65_46_12]|nr:MAG: hypothetical protein COW05_02585 [Gammaproteobacteria bacterium CG12_big_fil_rev_8_21_14_0_65_46_12]
MSRSISRLWAAEYLWEEHQLNVHAETLRLWLKAEGLWLPRRKRKAHRKRRERRFRYGELLQLDGSIHAWLPDMEGKQCLMNMVDDATGKTLALMDTGETTRAAFALLKWWISEAGIPQAIYVDLKSLYISPKALKQDDEALLVEPDWLTHFSKACKKLGIEIIKAYSPQAKGRVERSHGVYQDRLVKALKLKGIQRIEEANALLSGGFVNQLNAKFAKAPADSEDGHVPLLGGEDLDQIFCWEETRQVNNDWTIRYENQFYQLEKKACVRPKQTMTVRRHLDHSLSVWHKKVRLKAIRIDTKPATTVRKQKPKKTASGTVLSKHSTLNRHKTPWGKFNPEWLKSKKEKTSQQSGHLPTGSTSLPGVKLEHPGTCGLVDKCP